MGSRAVMLFKVLVGGRSCHGGDLAWSLPRLVAGAWVPGDWHEVQRVDLCREGLHLTSVPEAWWKPGATLYAVEAEQVSGDAAAETKVVARRVRLLRVVAPSEYAETRGVRVVAGRVDYGYGDGYGSGYGDGYGDGSGYGEGEGSGDGDGYDIVPDHGDYVEAAA